MIFTTPTFAIFFVLVLTLYFTLPHRAQNTMLLVASYIFYGWWDWRFLSLIMVSTLVDYTCALIIQGAANRRRAKIALITSILFNLGLLGFFKYFNFFADSLYSVLGMAGIEGDPLRLHIVLPVGISFYTFQTMSYTIDVWREKLQPTRNLLDFALFVSFFPQLVAGPIERAVHLLPIISSPRKVTKSHIDTGCWLILWGLFKKVVVSDHLARVVDPAFANPASLDLGSALVAVYAFAWQIYCDFSGYTDIARGCALCMGINLCLNFNLPYFATNPSDFWHRWHISLSSWLRDYVYIPLGGNRGSKYTVYRNLMTTMLLGGLWHGANWTFVAWGAFHGALLCIFRLANFAVREDEDPLGRLHILKIIGFFHLTCLGWIFFRIQSLADIPAFLVALTEFPNALPSGYWRLVFVAPVIGMQLLQYRYRDLLVVFRLWWPIRALLYVLIYGSLISLGKWSGNEFIYFQF